MKKTVIALICATVLIFTLTACGMGEGIDNAKAHIGLFFDAVEAGDIELASSCLHPEKSADLEEYFSSIERAESIDFSSGITIGRYTGVSSTYYDSNVGGSVYELEFEITVGTEDADAYVQIIDNDAGYGIMSITIDP